MARPSPENLARRPSGLPACGGGAPGPCSWLSPPGAGRKPPGAPRLSLAADFVQPRAPAGGRLDRGRRRVAGEIAGVPGLHAKLEALARRVFSSQRGDLMIADAVWNRLDEKLHALFESRHVGLEGFT